MKVEITDSFDTLMGMSVSQTLLIGTVLEYLIERGVIDRAPLLGELARRRMSFGCEPDDPHVWAFDVMGEALPRPRARSGSGATPKLRLVEQ